MHTYTQLSTAPILFIMKPLMKNPEEYTDSLLDTLPPTFWWEQPILSLGFYAERMLKTLCSADPLRQAFHFFRQVSQGTAKREVAYLEHISSLELLENVPEGKKEEKQNNKPNTQNLPSQYVQESAINSKRTWGHVIWLKPQRAAALEENTDRSSKWLHLLPVAPATQSLIKQKEKTGWAGKWAKDVGQCSSSRLTRWVCCSSQRRGMDSGRRKEHKLQLWTVIPGGKSGFHSPGLCNLLSH